MTQPPEWVVSTPSVPAIHEEPASNYQWEQLSQNELAELRSQLIEGIVSAVVEAISGFLPFARPALETLGSIFIDLFGLLGNPGGLGTGDPTLPSNPDDIPILGGLLSGLFGAITGGGSGGGLDGIGGFFEQLLGFLGLGGSGIGTGGTTTDPDDPDGGTVTPGTFDPDTALGKLATKLIGAGVLTTNTPIPPHLLTALTPGSSANLLPDASFLDQNAVRGEGLWVYDWPGKGSTTWGTSGCVRTKRTETVTIYWCGGTWEQNPGANLWAWPDPGTYLQKLSSNITINEDGTAEVIGSNLLDWTHFDVINVPYPGALYPMGGSIAEGAASVVKLINQIPGKFILMGLSQGAGVMSNVYDEIRHGSLSARNDDMLMGLVMGNIRRQKNRSFPGGPNYAPNGWGVYPTTLTNTEDRWWEWALEAGTYPAYDELDGITFDIGDPYAALGNTTAAETGLRDLVAQTAAAQTFDIISFYLLLITGSLTNPGFALVTAANTLLGTPHSDSHYLVQPFLAEGDHRTFWQYAIDYINDNFASEVSPPLEGIRHQLVGIQVPVQPLQVVVAGASVQWVNVVADGPAIMVGVNAYNAAGELITGEAHPTISVIADDATVTDPDSDSGGWTLLEASFVMPPGAATARLVFDVEPEAMTTGTVWFDEGRLEVSSLIDAGLLANIQNIPTLPGTSVEGPQGIADMLTAYQNLLDGVAAAATQDDMTGSELGATFEALGQRMLDAQNALQLSIQQQQQLANNSIHPLSNGLQPTGESTFSLADAVLTTVTVAAGHSIAGYINCAQTARKGFIEFLGRCTGTGVYLNVYKVDPATGDWTDLLWASDDISDVMGADIDWISITLSGAEEILVSASQLVALEIAADGAAVDVVCTGVTINDGGTPISLPNHPSATLANFGVTRTTASSGGISPATVDSSTSLTFNSTEPYVLFGVANVPPDYQPPEFWSEKSAGTYTYDIPAFAQAGDRFDVAVLAGSGGGETAGFGAIGFGGEAGKWKLASLVYGTDIPTTTTQLTVTVGGGGAAGVDGTASTISGTGVTTLTAAGGRTAHSPSEKGEGAEDKTWEGRRYFGGQEVAAGSPGAKPGGGGGGGSSGLFGIIGAMPTGAGADGAVWITVKQA